MKSPYERFIVTTSRLALSVIVAASITGLTAVSAVAATNHGTVQTHTTGRSTHVHGSAFTDAWHVVWVYYGDGSWRVTSTNTHLRTIPSAPTSYGHTP
jgi:hypothetical protein